MKYSVTLLSLAALAIAAKPEFTNTDFTVEEGKPFTLEFTGCEGGCTIVLQNGPDSDLQDYKTLTSSATGESFTVTLDDIPSDTYTFQIIDNESGDENWSVQFPYKGTAVATTATTAVTTTAEETTTAAPTTTEETTTEETTEATSTTAATTSAASTVTSPSSSAETTEASKTASDEATSTTEEPSTTQTSEIPDPDGAAGSLGAPMTLVLAAAAGLFFLN